VTIIQVKTHKLYIIKKRSNNTVSFVEFIFNSRQFKPMTTGSQPHDARRPRFNCVQTIETMSCDKTVTITRRGAFLHVDLHKLDVADRVKFKLGLTVHRCLSNKAPHYLADSCTLVSNIASQQRLRSAQHRHLDVPRHNCSTHDISHIHHRDLAVGHFLLPVLPSGIRFRTSFEIKAVQKALSNSR